MERGSLLPVQLLLDGFQIYWEKGFTFPAHLLVDGTEFQAVVEKGYLLPVELLQDGTHWVPNIIILGEGFHFSSTSTSRGNWVPCIVQVTVMLITFHQLLIIRKHYQSTLFLN